MPSEKMHLITAYGVRNVRYRIQLYQKDTCPLEPHQIMLPLQAPSMSVA
jgi:hypothetical protein